MGSVYGYLEMEGLIGDRGLSEAYRKKAFELNAIERKKTPDTSKGK